MSELAFRREPSVIVAGEVSDLMDMDVFTIARFDASRQPIMVAVEDQAKSIITMDSIDCHAGWTKIFSLTDGCPLVQVEIGGPAAGKEQPEGGEFGLGVLLGRRDLIS